MESVLQLLAGVATLGCFSFVPLLISVVAIVDVVRVGAEWYWIPIIFFFPVMGAIAYFVVVRSPWAGGGIARLSPASARRAQARRRLRDLEVQLAHWRGPVPLAEAGEELLVLGKAQQAEAYLAESYDAEGPIAEVNYRFGLALAVRGKWDEAAEVMEELYEEDPEARLGEARLHYARCLDEAGLKDRAEAVLREVLTKRKPIEARVRLARILLGKGETAEAQGLLREVVDEARLLPRYLRREHRAWISAAKRLDSAQRKLPAFKVPGSFQRRSWGTVAAVAAAVLLVMLLALGWVAYQVQSSMEPYQDSSGYEDYEDYPDEPGAQDAPAEQPEAPPADESSP